jgi:catechol 2,3-dioxygenase-like lactoylglutathione lyase family enzyme
MFLQRSAAALLLAVTLSAASIVTSPPVPAWAFDTGPHASITSDAVTAAGLNLNAAYAVAVENWLTDYYTSTSFGDEACQLDKLHFDDLFSPNDIRAYWWNLVANTNTAVGKAEQDDDVLEFLTVLGMSLHVVQDFYSHSNWIDQNGVSVQPGHYSTKTWFQTPDPKPAGLHTGWYPNCLKIPQDGHERHGDYTSGLNHDSVVRPGYDRAYVYAYAASYEWTKNLLDWISPGFKAKVLSYAPSASDLEDLTYDRQASIYISEWISTPSADGHWNGNRSGNATDLALFIARWTAHHDSIYVRTFKSAKIYGVLSKDQYTGRSGRSSPITPYPISGRIFEMRVLETWDNDPFRPNPDHHYFGQLTAKSGDGQTPSGEHGFRDAGQPVGEVPWRQLIFVPGDVGSLKLTYSLWQEQGLSITVDPTQPYAVINSRESISGARRLLQFLCVVASSKTPPGTCSGDITGGPWTESNPYTTNGDNAGATLYFTSSPADP